MHEFQSESVPARISALADARDIKAAGLLNNDGSMSEPGAIKPVKFTICGTRALSTCCVTHAPQSMEGDVYLQRGEFYLTRAAVENANAFFIANDSQLQYDTGMYLHRPTLASAVFGLAFGAALCPLRAHTRHFTYLYEATVSARGEVELENWVTWTGSSGENGRFNGFAFRHEVEFGVTDRFQLSLYVADWTYVNDPKNHQHGARFQDAALEAIYQLSDPANDPIGSALYGEVRGGDRFAELEAKLILEKDVGPWIFAYNATLEAKWEGEGLREKEGEFSQALGISRRFDHHFYAGAELEHEVGLPNWNRAAHSVVSAGPNAGLRFGRWYATVTPLFQLTRIASEPDFQTRLIIGTEF